MSQIKMKIKKGDKVQVMSGKDKGTKGTVVKVLREAQKVIVEGVNLKTKFVKVGKGKEGQTPKVESPIAASNVQVIDPKTGEPTRVGYQVNKDGKKVRVAKKSGAEIK